MSVKRGRGRPRKNARPKIELLDNETTNLSLITTAVSQATRKRPRKGTSKEFISGANLESNEDFDEEEDSEFIPEVEPALNEEGKIKPSRRRKTTLKKNKISPTDGSKTVQRGSTLELKGRIIRALKDLSSARDKLERIYGLNEEKLLRLAKVKEGFETCVFCFPLDVIQQSSPYFVKYTPPCAVRNVYDQLLAQSLPKLHDIDQAELDHIFKKRKQAIKVVINEAETALELEQATEFPVFPYGRREGLVYNSGGLITDIAWLCQNEVEDQFLAVALSQHFARPLDRHLRMLEAESHVACIEIFRFNPSTLKFVKIQTIAHTFGEVWNLKWHEGCQKDGILGALGFTCQEGCFKLLEIKIPGDGLHSVQLYEEASVSVSMPNTIITCYDFLSPTSIVCGFKNGFVAVFDLTDPGSPSFYHKLHDSYVISISVAFSDFERSTVGTLSFDGYFYIFDPKDIFSSKTTVTRFRGTNLIPIEYMPQLYAFVHSDGANSLKTVVPRAAFAIHTVSLQETSIVSLGTSRLHPLSLVGNSDGTVVVDNVSRRILTGIKNNSNTHSSLRLWKWEYSKKEDKYRLNHNYEPYKLSVNEISGVKLDAHGVNISCVEWNETNAAGQFYAFANSAGLLTIEKLG